MSNSPAAEIIPVNIEQELKQSYLDYAMSVIVGRALPDVRDGLKPVHRRVLYAMSELNNDWNKAYKKSARIVGDVIGKYHPHGDTAVYDTIVRMAQPFSLRYMLVDGQGNFGSVDGDSPAAMRYTEVRMSHLAHSLLIDIDKETVDFAPNYDETEFAPLVLPTRVPNLLVNGSTGIAVGMATNIPPHNLNEVINATIALIEDPELSIKDLLKHIPGPDFPTYGIIHGRAGIVQAYQTGRGRVYVRAKHHIETNKKNGKESIIVTELPYQINKARLLEKIAELVKTKRVDGIVALRDESDKDGMRMVIELRRGENSEVLINNLYHHTKLQSVFAINMVALFDGRPRILNLKEILSAFIRHRREVVTRRTVYELRKARERAHILEGLSVALANIDSIIASIKASPSPAIAKEKLLAQSWQPGLVAKMLEKTDTSMSRPDDLPSGVGFVDDSYRFSPTQAQAILELRLHRLTGLEQDKIISEYQAILKQISDLLEIITYPNRLMAIIREELAEIREQFGDKRRTEIVESAVDLTTEDLIPEEDMVVTLSHEGYVKSQPLDTYHAQRRGGRGKTATSMKEEDFIERLVIANSHDTILCFSTLGRLYWLKVYQLPQASRTSRGRPIVNLLPLSENEKITTVMPIREYTPNKFVFLATATGIVKKVSLTDFSHPRPSGIRAINLDDGDHLIGASITDGSNDIMLFTSAGKAIRFSEKNVRCMGRTAHGVRGIRLREGQLGEVQTVKSLVVIQPGGAIITATENGYGKRTAIEAYSTISRGGQGTISIKVSERNGNVVRATQVAEGDEVMLITNRGTLVRIRVGEISIVSRNTKGVKLINLTNGEKLMGMQKIEELEGKE